MLLLFVFTESLSGAYPKSLSFVSGAHTDANIDEAMDKVCQALEKVFG
ncbi:MAG: hypothetical protein AAF433_11120 [Bacteroidota bacterium]